MDNISIYERIAERTQGDVYVGVVGPVRTGKSTFIKRFVDLLVVPNVTNVYVKQRIQDELPQSGAGKTITTAEPKFVPAEAVGLELAGNASCKVRLVDCVGYMIPGAAGHMEDGKARMVSTPWNEDKLPFEEAAEIGTRKVIEDHSTIGIVITTDGSIGDIPRENYEATEERVIKELKELGKPFVVILNTTTPSDEMTKAMTEELESKYGIPVKPLNCAKMNVAALEGILENALCQFPPSEIRFHLPGFIEGLTRGHRIKDTIINSVRDWTKAFENINDLKKTAHKLIDGEIVTGVNITNIDLGNGVTEIAAEVAEGLFYKVVEELMGQKVNNDYEFFELLKEFASAKKSYDKIKSAMQQVEDTGYGIVQPKLTEMALEEPEIFRQGSKYGVRLRAKAPSLHIIKTDITTEISPIVGTEKQSEDLIKYLIDEFEGDPCKIWNTNIFGKSLYEMVTEQMENKLSNVPDNIRVKIQRSLQKISDEGKEYFICIVL